MTVCRKQHYLHDNRENPFVTIEVIDFGCHERVLTVTAYDCSHAIGLHSLNDFTVRGRVPRVFIRAGLGELKYRNAFPW